MNNRGTGSSQSAQATNFVGDNPHVMQQQLRVEASRLLSDQLAQTKEENEGVTASKRLHQPIGKLSDGVRQQLEDKQKQHTFTPNINRTSHRIAAQHRTSATNYDTEQDVQSTSLEYVDGKWIKNSLCNKSASGYHVPTPNLNSQGSYHFARGQKWLQVGYAARTIFHLHLRTGCLL